MTKYSVLILLHPLSMGTVEVHLILRVVTKILVGRGAMESGSITFGTVRALQKVFTPAFQFIKYSEKLKLLRMV